MVERDGALIMAYYERLPLKPGETPRLLGARFRTLGCYPLTGAIESDADSIEAIIDEMERRLSSERHGRLIDFDQVRLHGKKEAAGVLLISRLASLRKIAPEQHALRGDGACEPAAVHHLRLS